MAKTEVVRVRINPELKRNVEALLSKLGLTTTEAITLFFRQMELRNGLPFPVELPNEETRDVLKRRIEGKNWSNVKTPMACLRSSTFDAASFLF